MTVMKVFAGLACWLLVAACMTACGDEGGDGGAGGGGTGGTGGDPCANLTQHEECVSGLPVAKAKKLPAGFSIDTTEVTRKQYAAWLATEPSVSGSPSNCSFNASYEPGCHWPPGDQPNHPVVCVDWCDAYAYCAGLGKRLCGKIGGGPNGFEDSADATKSEWYYACTSNGAQDYPYSDEYDPKACNSADDGDDVMYEVGSRSTCQASGDFAGVFDLVGNVSEWEDCCFQYEGAEDQCRSRGGAFPYSSLKPGCYAGGQDDRRMRTEMDGIRCCDD